MAKKHIFYNGIATTTEQTTFVDIPDIFMIANDDDTNDLYLSFDESISNGNYIVIKPDEIFENFEDLYCKNLYYKSSAGTVRFRVAGKNINHTI